MLKPILAVISVIFGGYIGFFLSQKKEKRIIELEQCQTLMQRIRAYLEYEKAPTKTIIKKLSQSEALANLTFLKRCDELLEKEKNFPLMWNKSIQETTHILSLNKEDLNLLKQLSEILGMHDFNAQTNGILVIESQINKQLETAIEKNKTQGKLYRSLGVLGGLATAILVI